METEKGFCIHKNNTNYDKQLRFEELNILIYLMTMVHLIILLSQDQRPQLWNVNFLVIIILLQLTSW